MHPARTGLYPATTRKISSIHNTRETPSILIIISPTSLYIFCPLAYQKLTVISLKICLCRPAHLEAKFSLALERAEFSVPPRTALSSQALDFHMTHRIILSNCVLQKSQQYLKYCALQLPRRQRVKQGRCQSFVPYSCAPSSHQAWPSHDKENIMD